MKIQAINRIDYDGEGYNPGDQFVCRKEEGHRLIKLGAAKLPDPVIEPDSDEDPDAELLEKIKAAQSVEEIEKLSPEDPSEAVIKAAMDRVAELEKE